MSANKAVRFGPVTLTNTLTTNILNPGTTTGGVGMPLTSTNLYFILRHLRVINKTATAATVSRWIGGSGANTAGTEFAWQATSVPANGYLDWYGAGRLDAADFLVGGAGAATALTLSGEGDLGVD